jgi:hypothetical protein
MRARSYLRSGVFLGLGCNGRPSAETVLVELASAHADPLATGITAAVEAEKGSLWDLSDGEERSGVLDLPDDEGEGWSADAAVALAWELVYTEDEYGIRTWRWTLDITLDRLSLPSADLAGRALWTMEDVAWDLHYTNHAWDGEVSVDGAEPVPATWTAYYSGNLHRVDGTVDGERVHWVSDDPDLP